MQTINPNIITNNAKLFSVVETLVKVFPNSRAFFVGGCVRDAILQRPCKDVDIEIHGVDETRLVNFLQTFGRAELVGKAFGVTKISLDGEDFDFAVPRTEEKSGQGHKGFKVALNPNLGFEDAAKRRDFTINALMVDCLTGQLLDFFGGLDDLRNGVLRHTSEKFAEDALRAVRAWRFSAVLGFAVSSDTAALCKSLLAEASLLSKERIWEEILKVAAKGKNLTKANTFLVESGWDSVIPVNVQTNTFGQNDTGLMRMFNLLAPKVRNKTALLDMRASIETAREVAEIQNLFAACRNAVELRKTVAKAKFAPKTDVLRLLQAHGLCSSDDAKTVFGQLNFLTPFVTGQDLIALGFKEGKALGQTLQKLFDLQLENLLIKEELLKQL